MPPQIPDTNIHKLRASALATDVLHSRKVCVSMVKLYGSGQMELSKVSESRKNKIS